MLYLPWRVAWPFCVVMSGVAAAEEALSLGRWRPSIRSSAS
ncbi:hypothetical protein [Nonomuraea rubra]